MSSRALARCVDGGTEFCRGSAACMRDRRAAGLGCICVREMPLKRKTPMLARLPIYIGKVGGLTFAPQPSKCD
jgi:hypothetical protein